LLPEHIARQYLAFGSVLDSDKNEGL